MENSESYRAYMLRMWSAEQSGQLVWRASLEDSHTGELFGFANLLLFDYLRNEALGALSPDKSSNHLSLPG
jgi:hypothetical protein